MNRDQREAYQAELGRVAASLALPTTDDVEQAIIDHFVGRLRTWVTLHGAPQNLSELTADFATSLDMQFAEVFDQEDMDQLLLSMPRGEQATVAMLNTEFGDQTDAVTIRRSQPKSWERPYLAIINCQDWHELRRYYSKWHEIVHRLIEGQQLRFAFRHTKVDRPEPEEVLVDRIAGALAFFPDMFRPVVIDEVQIDGRLAFGTIDRVRARIAPDASRQATSMACMRHVANPSWLLRCGLGLKNSEQRRLDNPQMSLIPGRSPRKKLRIRQSLPNPAARSSGTTFYPNMRVPKSSIIAQAFNNEFDLGAVGKEPLDHWETSASGPIGSGTIHVEAEWVTNDEVWAIVQTLD